MIFRMTEMFDSADRLRHELQKEVVDVTPGPLVSLHTVGYDPSQIHQKIIDIWSGSGMNCMYHGKELHGMSLTDLDILQACFKKWSQQIKKENDRNV